MVEFVKPDRHLIETIAKDMRQSDVVEVMASHGRTPLEALMYSFEKSEFSAVAIDNGIPLSMVGLRILNITTGLGSPWMLSSNQVFNHKEYLLTGTKLMMDSMLSICPRLINYVHHANKTSIKWLSSIGFTINDLESYGVKGDLFHKFHMGVF